MGVRGIDISNHQAGMDVERVVRENNIGFVFVLSNDGTFKNPYYQAQMAAARRGGAEAVPYIYLRTNVDQTFSTFRQQEPAPGPAIVDVEDGSGARSECDRMHRLLHDAGYTTPFLYWPDWYRRKVGSPSLAGLPPLWTSYYPDNVSRGFDQGLALMPSWLWNGYGGLVTKILQFTSSGRLSGYGGNLDLNYFPGTRDELAASLGGAQEGDDMAGRGDEIASVLDGYYTARKAQGDQETHDLGTAIYDIETVVGQAYDPATGEGLGAHVRKTREDIESLKGAVEALKAAVAGMQTGTGYTLEQIARAAAAATVAELKKEGN